MEETSNKVAAELAVVELQDELADYRLVARALDANLVEQHQRAEHLMELLQHIYREHRGVGMHEAICNQCGEARRLVVEWEEHWKATYG